jgi:hypothetical protein
MIFAAKKTVFWGVGALTRAHTPKYGGLSREFPKNLTVRKAIISRTGIIEKIKYSIRISLFG